MFLLHIYKKEDITKINGDTSRPFSISSPTLPTGLSARSLLSTRQPTLAAVSGPSWPLGRISSKMAAHFSPGLSSSFGLPLVKVWCCRFLDPTRCVKKLSEPSQSFPNDPQGVCCLKQEGSVGILLCHQEDS